MTVVTALIWSAILLWLMIMIGSLLKYRGWTPTGMAIMSGNREQTGEPTPLGGRADRAAKNMMENMILFVAVSVAVLYAGKAEGLAATGATVFFWARLAYWPVYLMGIHFVRTGLWAISVIGMAMMVYATF